MEKLKRDVSDMQQQQLQQQQLQPTGPMFSEQTRSDLDDLHSLFSLSSLDEGSSYMSTPPFNAASNNMISPPQALLVAGNFMSPPPPPIMSPPPAPPPVIYQPRANSLPPTIPVRFAQLQHNPAITLGPSKEPPTKQRNLKPLPIPPYMPLKTAEEVFKKNSKYLNKDDIGRVAAKLARATFFGESVLVQSSISGTDNTRPLDPSVLQQLKDTIRQKFMHMSPTDYETIWSKCVDSLSRLCTYCRKNN